jgi:hypothetical protein
LELKDIALLLSPIVAILVAVGTVFFNVYDRKRHYTLEREKLALEREKIAQDLAKALLNGSKALEKRIELYNELMARVSAITHEAQAALRSLTKGLRTSWDHNQTVYHLDELLTAIRKNQTFTTQFVHESITRNYAVRVTDLSVKIDEMTTESMITEVDSAVNQLTQIITLNDDLKTNIRDDLEAFIRGIGRISSAV